MAKSRLGDNPLFGGNESEAFDAEKERQELGITLPEKKKQGRPRKDNLVRTNAAQEGLPEDWQRATFIVRVEHLEKLKDYAYTERLSLKEALDDALEQFLEDKDNLLPHK